MKAFLVTGNMRAAARARMVSAIRGTGIRDVVVQVVDQHSHVRQVRGADVLIVDMRYATHAVTDGARLLHPNIPCVVLTTTNSARIASAVRAQLNARVKT